MLNDDPGDAAQAAKRDVITPRHIQLAVLGDLDFKSLIKAIIPRGGVLPAIHPALFPELMKASLQGSVGDSDGQIEWNERNKYNVI